MPGFTSVNSIFGLTELEHSSSVHSLSAEIFGRRITAFSTTSRIKTTATIFFMVFVCNCVAKLIFAGPVVNRINMCISTNPYQNKKATFSGGPFVYD